MKKSEQTTFYEKKAFSNEILSLKKDEDHGCHKHFHRKIELSYILDGEHKFYINNKIVTATANDLVFFNSLDIHQYDYSNYGKHILIIINENYYFNNFANNKIPILENHLNDKTFNSEILDVLNFIEKKLPDLSQIELQGWITVVLGMLLRHYGEVQKQYTNNNIVSIISYICDHYSEEITRNSLAKKFGYIPSYISNLFRSNLNMTMKDFINTLRYENAQAEIDRDISNRTKTEIILSCGFSNTQSFYRIKRKKDDLNHTI